MTSNYNSPMKKNPFEEMVFREVKSLAQNQMASTWLSWDLRFHLDCAASVPECYRK